MAAHRKVISSDQAAPCADPPSSLDPYLPAGHPTITQDLKALGIARLRACLGQQQLLDVTRQVFDVARTGDAASFKRLLRQKKTGATAINFQYSTRVAEEGGSNLWPWYWCVDTRDALALCWRAPSGIEPETGDTLLMITLKLGMEEHVEHLLDHQALDLSIRNSSSRDVPAVAARYGRESLTSNLQTRFALGERRRKRLIARAEPSWKIRKQQRRRRQRRRCPETRQGLEPERFRDDPACSDASLSGMSMSSRVDDGSSRGTATARVPGHNFGDNQGDQQVVGSDERHPFTTGAESGTAMATSSVRSQGRERVDVQGETESAGGYTGCGGRRNSTEADGSEIRPLRSPRLHTQPSGTRAIAVQTDFVAPDDRGIAPVRCARQTLESQATPSLLSQRRFADGARRLRRSTAPGDLKFHALNAQYLSSFTAVPDAMDGSERSNVRGNLIGMDPTLSPNLSNCRTEGEHPAASVDYTPSRSSSSSSTSTSTVLPIRLRVDKRESPSLRSGDRIGNTDALEAESTTTEQQEELVCDRLERDLTVEEDCGEDKTNPPFANGSKVDDVTRQVQQLLREDALQDDGTLDYSAAFELFDVDHDGIVNPVELHSLFVRLGMGNLLHEEGIGMIVARVPRSNSGLITQKELQMFAERPGDLPWVRHRDSGGNSSAQVVGGSEGVGAGPTVSLVLHELQVKAIPSVGGAFWKKASKDLSSVSLFVRVTRGRHIAESAAVYPRLLPSESCGDGSGGVSEDGPTSAGKRKDERATWSWRWGETMVLSAPALCTSAAQLHGASPSEVSRADHHQVASPQEQHKAGLQEGNGSGYFADSPASVATDSNRSRVSPEETCLSVAGAPSACETESSTTVAGLGGVVADDVQQGGDDFSSSDFDARYDGGSSAIDATTRSGEARVVSDGTQKGVHRSSGNRSNNFHESRPDTWVKLDATPAEKGEVQAKASAPELMAGAKKRRGLSLWSPTRRRRSVAAVTKTNAVGVRGSDVGSSSYCNEAVQTTRDFSADTADGRAGGRRPSSSSGVGKDPDILDGTHSTSKICGKDGGNDEQGRADGGSGGDHSESLESFPEPSTTMKGIVAVREAVTDKVKVAATDLSGRVMRRRGLSFWSPGKGRKSIGAKTGAADFVTRSGTLETDNRDGGKQNSAANGVEATPAESRPGEDDCPSEYVASHSDTGGAAALAHLEGCADGSNGTETSKDDNMDITGGDIVETVVRKTDKSSPGGLLQRGGALFWSPKRTLSNRNAETAGDAKTTQVNHVGEDGPASDDIDASAATPHRILPDVSTKKQGSRGTLRERTRPAPSQVLAEPGVADVLVLEVWEVKNPDTPKPRAAQGSDVASAERSDSGVQFAPEYGLKNMNSCGSLPRVAEYSGQSDRDEGFPSTRNPTDKRPGGDETAGDFMPPSGDHVRAPGTVCGRPGDDNDEECPRINLSIAQQVCTGDDHVSMAMREVEGVDNDASIEMLGASAKSAFRMETSLFSPQVGGGGSETKATLCPSGFEPPVRLPKIDTKSTVCSKETDQNNADVREKSGFDGDDGDDDDDDDDNDEEDDGVSVVSLVSFASDMSPASEISTKQARTGRVGRRSRFSSPFSSPFKGRLANRKRLPQQQPASRELPPSDQQKPSPDLLSMEHFPDTERGRHPKSIGSSSPVRFNSALWGQLTVPVADVSSKGQGGDSSINHEHAVGEFALDGGNDLTSAVSSDCLPPQPLASARGRESSSIFRMHLSRREAKRQAGEQATADRADSTETSQNLAVDSWFEVRNPKGKLGNRVKGRVRLTWIGGC